MERPGARQSGSGYTSQKSRQTPGPEWSEDDTKESKGTLRPAQISQVKSKPLQKCVQILLKNIDWIVIVQVLAYIYKSNGNSTCCLIYFAGGVDGHRLREEPCLAAAAGRMIYSV